MPLVCLVHILWRCDDLVSTVWAPVCMLCVCVCVCVYSLTTVTYSNTAKTLTIAGAANSALLIKQNIPFCKGYIHLIDTVSTLCSIYCMHCAQSRIFSLI